MDINSDINKHHTSCSGNIHNLNYVTGLQWCHHRIELHREQDSECKQVACEIVSTKLKTA